MTVKKRCCFCRKYLRPDGTCHNENCVRYVPEVVTDTDVTEEKNETDGKVN